MFSKDELDYLKKIPIRKRAKVIPYDPELKKIAGKIIESVKDVFTNLEIKHMGASALKISGQNDLDIYAFSNPSEFNKYLPGLIKIFGEPLHKHETFIEWNFKKRKFNVQFYLTQKDSPTMQKQIKVFEMLKEKPELLKEYENLKYSLDKKSFREYQKKKYDFYHKILE